MSATIDNLHVVFRVDRAEYVLPAASVLELESFTGATPVPGAAPYIAGLVQIRGRVIPVVDLRKRFGMPAVDRQLEHRVIVVEHEGRQVGLLVDTAREVMRVPAEAFRPPPELIVEQAGPYVKAVAEVDKRLLMLLDPHFLLVQEDRNGKQRQDQ
jgi:purine-binding chemotaxis protein CheW